MATTKQALAGAVARLFARDFSELDLYINCGIAAAIRQLAYEHPSALYVNGRGLMLLARNNAPALSLMIWGEDAAAIPSNSEFDGKILSELEPVFQGLRRSYADDEQALDHLEQRWLEVRLVLDAEAVEAEVAADLDRFR